MTNHKIYVYGTLRPGKSETVQVPGLLYDLGWYPGAALKAPDCGTSFTAEIIEADDTELARLDRYEGYRGDDLASSLYLRQPYLDGFIYVYNHSFKDREVVESGDWLVHTNKERGVAA